MKKQTKIAVLLGLVFVFTLSMVSRHTNQLIASSSTTMELRENSATIECDTTSGTMTKNPTKISGVIVNGGSIKAYINVAGGTVVTTDAEAQSIVGLPAGCSFRITRFTSDTIKHKTASSSTTLYWFPD